LGLSSTRVGFE